MPICQNMLETFYCSSCDYKCSKKSSWGQHLMTSKHSKAINGLNKANKKYACEKCKIQFKHQSSYSRHKKACLEKNNAVTTDEMYNNISDKELIMMLLKQNSELLEVVKNGTNNTTISNSNNHSNNKTFNLQFFLNETCKNAMNIMDFVDSIKLQLSDLETVGKLGYVEGITNIINENLKALDVTQRPVHCTDKKREVLYVKDENKWEKENESKTKIRKAIKHISHKNSKLIPVFRDKYPDCGKSISKYADQFNKIVIEAMGGAGDNDTEKENKIIANISKHVTINKDIE